MELWAAAAARLVSIGLTAVFGLAYRRGKKKRFLVLAIAMALIMLEATFYAGLTLILIGGIDS